MVIAWIRWRSVDEVRNSWDACRTATWYWQPEGRGYVPRRRKPAELIDIMTTYPRLFGGLLEVANYAEAVQLLKAEGQRGGFVATWIRREESARTDIPAANWHDLKPCDGANGLGLNSRHRPNSGGDEVLYPRKRIIKLWPTATAALRARKATMKEQEQCQEWLEAEMKDYPDQRQKTKGEYREEAVRKYGRITDRAFNTLWANATHAANAPAWRLPGRPGKMKS